MKHLIIIFKFLLISHFLYAQNLIFEYSKTPVNSGFKMEGYWVWGGSMIKVDSVYYLFASRWPKTSQFPDGYRTNSEIVHATSRSPMGPFNFEEVVLGERDSSYWDANMTHNPTIHKIGDEFVLFYIGSDFSTYRDQSKELLRRVGCATSKSINGPWKRSDKPLLETESNNPAILFDNGKVLLMFRNAQLQIFIAEAANFKGPYKIVNDNVWPDCKLEDFYLFKAYNRYHMICEDNMGGVSGNERWGINLFSDNGVNNWKKYDPVIVYNHEIELENDSILHCTRRERPQLLIENNEITYLITAVYDGKNSWCQPVKLSQPIHIK